MGAHGNMPPAMMLDGALSRIDWGFVYVASEWLVRVAALVYVPQRRAPSAARAWLLLIFFLPWPGVLLYLLIGRAYMPRRRFKIQKQIFELVRHLATRALSFDASVAQAVSPELLPALRLADRLSEFPAVGGNRFTLLPRTTPRSTASSPTSMARNATFTCCSTSSRTTRSGDGSPTRSCAQPGAASRCACSWMRSARAQALKRLGPSLRAAGVEVVSLMPLAAVGSERRALRPPQPPQDRRGRRQQCAYFGSQNIVSAHANRGMVNEEMLVRATGPIVRHLHAVLLGDRYLETGTLPPESDDLTPAPSSQTHRDGLAQVVPSGPGYNEGTAEAVMIALMYGARSRVVLTSPYVIPSEPFLSAMCSTARRGVTVDLIVDAESNKPMVQLAQQSYYDAMLRAGVAIHRHRGSFLHAKHMSVDDDVALVGSSNLDIRSFALNAEVSVLICDRAVRRRPARDPGQLPRRMRPRHARRARRTCGWRGAR